MAKTAKNCRLNYKYLFAGNCCERTFVLCVKSGLAKSFSVTPTSSFPCRAGEGIARGRIDAVFRPEINVQLISAKPRNPVDLKGILKTVFKNPVDLKVILKIVSRKNDSSIVRRFPRRWQTQRVAPRNDVR